MGIWPHVFWFSKKRALVSLALVLMVLTVIGYGLKSQYRRAEDQSKRLEVVLGASNELLEDPDGDGLKNWEETLWKTDPNKADTDGDGTPDSEEARAASAAAPASDKKPSTPIPVSGVTEELTRALINEGALGNLSEGFSNPLSEEKIAAISNSYIAESAKAAEDGINSLRYDMSNSSTSIKAYLNGVADLYLHAYESVEKSDLETIAEVIRDSDPSDISKLDPYIFATEALKKNYRALVAPIALKIFHEEGSRIISKTLFELKAVRNIERDPIGAMLGFQNRVLTKIQLTNMYDIELRDWIRQTKIVFGKEEIGHLMFGW